MTSDKVCVWRTLLWLNGSNTGLSQETQACFLCYIVDLFMCVGVDYSARAGRTAQSQLIDSFALKGIKKNKVIKKTLYKINK